MLLVLAGALVLGALAQLSWRQGFRLADAGLALVGLAAAWRELLIAGWVLGAIGLAVPVLGTVVAVRAARVGDIPPGYPVPGAHSR
ncbi:hypothetical protein GCM10022240_31050 [Microbacterium kribbense]|uniref:Uncharacterized protein n=1 Tax=Microbacterium kribbense TaxID=433645 RepID=A0ABP7H022_9MICO